MWYNVTVPFFISEAHMEQAKNDFHYTYANRHFKDLNPILTGYENCPPGKVWGPDVRNYTLIHYVIKGQGVLYKNGREFPVHGGEAFLIRPHEIITYIADVQAPWQYQWIGFDGELSAKFCELDDVFKFSENPVEEILECSNEELCEYVTAALLFRMYAELMKPHEKKYDYTEQVKDYVKALYMRPISVEEIALQLNLDRRYLSRIFKKRTGKTIQEYIISVRMKAAKKYLLEGIPVEEAAALSGYDDRSNFSKLFKRKFGVSPVRWKKENS